MKDNDGLREIKRTRRDVDIVIPPCDGSVTLTDPGNSFVIKDKDLKFLKINCRRPGKTTKEMPVGMHEVKGAVDSLSEVFDSLRGIKERVSDPFRMEMDSLCLTEHQIVHFLDKYREWIINNPMTRVFFLLRVKDQYLVVIAQREWGNKREWNNDEISLIFCRLEGDDFSCCGGINWVIFPQ